MRIDIMEILHMLDTPISADVYSTFALSLNKQDSLPTFPDVEEFSCIEKKLGLPLDTFYSSITPPLVAATSLGQVYKARLKYSGQDVAMKVKRTGFEEAIRLDYYLIRNLGIFINKNIDIITSDVVALIDEFARRVYQELNYMQEGHNARRFKKLYSDKEDVLMPDILWDNTSIQCSLRKLLEYGFFHADPHPSNLLATLERKLAFLDFGMMSETPEEARFTIIGHVVQMVNRDYEAMAQDYYALDFMSVYVDVSPILQVLRNFFDDALTLTVNKLNFKTLVDGLGAVLYQYPFNGHGRCCSCCPLRVLLCLQWKKEEGSTLHIIAVVGSVTVVVRTSNGAVLVWTCSLSKICMVFGGLDYGRIRLRGIQVGFEMRWRFTTVEERNLYLSSLEECLVQAEDQLVEDQGLTGGSGPFTNKTGSSYGGDRVVDKMRIHRSSRLRLIDEGINEYETSVSGLAPMEEGSDVVQLIIVVDAPLAMVVPEISVSENSTFKSLGIKRKRQKKIDSLPRNVSITLKPAKERGGEGASKVVEGMEEERLTRKVPKPASTKAEKGKGKAFPVSPRVQQTMVSQHRQRRALGEDDAEDMDEELTTSEWEEQARTKAASMAILCGTGPDDASRQMKKNRCLGARFQQGTEGGNEAVKASGINMRGDLKLSVIIIRRLKEFKEDLGYDPETLQPLSRTIDPVIDDPIQKVRTEVYIVGDGEGDGVEASVVEGIAAGTTTEGGGAVGVKKLFGRDSATTPI
ncbi:hypothetical protein GIB67_031377 [Kingdonia uniflora]|uniref:Protein kinase domain-containing protein n=1 Tax=Kingdonia uniflora TaxID=39325 RepID=A0A7J7MAX6_9MAGN|nr:hypothetical protein GIB67_031377 [Kingdonia uniflora]